MPRRKSKSNKASNKPPPATAPEQASVDPRMGVPLHPPGTEFDYPDTMVPWPEEYDPLPKPKLRTLWTEEQLGGWLVLAGQVRAYFATEAARRGRRIKWKERVEYIKTLAAPAGSPWKNVSGNIAETLATTCWDPVMGEGEDDE
jgi:hypothetical protein